MLPPAAASSFNRHGVRFQDYIKSSLSKVIESCFKEPDLMKFRSNAIAALHSLTEANSTGTAHFIPTNLKRL